MSARYIAALTAFFLFFVNLSAQIKLPAIISDNMILQQNATVSLWGWTSPGEPIARLQILFKNGNPLTCLRHHGAVNTWPPQRLFLRC